jgi:hypothetical protein
MMFDAIGVLFLLLVLIAVLIALDVQIAATERAWGEIAAWRSHHIATLQGQHEWFRHQWRSVHGRARPQPTPRETPLAKRAEGSLSDAPSDATPRGSDTGRYRLAERLEPEGRPGDTLRSGPPEFDPRDTVASGPPSGVITNGKSVSHVSCHRHTPDFPS